MSTQGLRLAATRLAALHRDDRAWLLAQLPAEQASALRELLDLRQLKEWAARLGKGVDTLTPPAKPAMKAPPKTLPAALETLGVAWQALWLAANHPGDVADRVERMERLRAGRLLEDSQRYEAVLPSGLREALAQWPAARAQSFTEVL